MALFIRLQESFSQRSLYIMLITFTDATIKGDSTTYPINSSDYPSEQKQLHIVKIPVTESLDTSADHGAKIYQLKTGGQILHIADVKAIHDVNKSNEMTQFKYIYHYHLGPENTVYLKVFEETYNSGSKSYTDLQPHKIPAGYYIALTLVIGAID